MLMSICRCWSMTMERAGCNRSGLWLHRTARAMAWQRFFFYLDHAYTQTIKCRDTERARLSLAGRKSVAAGCGLSEASK